MDKNDINLTLTSVFQRVFQEPGLAVTRETTAREVAKWDSLRHIEMITDVESTFAVKFSLREVMKLKNVGDLIDLIHAKQSS
jgi:acyl carrier protein